MADLQALAGQGIALLPESTVRTALAKGELLPVLPGWTLPQGVFHVVFPHRRGLLPAVRAFIEANPQWETAIWGVYGGDAPTMRAKALLPDVAAWSRKGFDAASR